MDTNPAPLIFAATVDEDGPLQVLLQVWVDEGVAEIAYRRRTWETWGPPQMLKLVPS
jgi:hypothetical protein